MVEKVPIFSMFSGLGLRVGVKIFYFFFWRPMGLLDLRV
jgi:hypothetical protein